MTEPRALVLAGNGTNCERETAHACHLGGIERVDVVMLWDLLAGEVALADYHLLCLPGGFLDGDDLGAAQAGAVRWRYGWVERDGARTRLMDHVAEFVAAGKLILGICNGFQLMTKLGLLPALPGDDRSQASLAHNDSGRFEARWVRLRVDPDSPCVFTRGLTELELPVRHGEGKLVCATDAIRAAVTESHLAPLRYLDWESGEPTEAYPANPNGSRDGWAGLCDPSGRCFGLMPHPEAFTHRTNHPQWTRRADLPEEGAGVALFRNAAEFIRREL